MSAPFLLDYLPEGEVLFKHAAPEQHSFGSIDPKKLMAALAVTTAGGGLGYAGGKLLASKYGPGVPPAALAAIGALLSGAVVSAQAAHDKKFSEVVRHGREDRKDLTSGRRA